MLNRVGVAVYGDRSSLNIIHQLFEHRFKERESIVNHLKSLPRLAEKSKNSAVTTEATVWEAPSLGVASQKLFL